MPSLSRAQSLTIITCLILSLSAAIGSKALKAQDEPGLHKVAVIDIQKILSEASVVLDFTQRIETLQLDYRRALRSREEEFRELDRDLARERLNLDPATFAVRRQALQGSAADLQKEFGNRRRELDQRFRLGMTRVQETLASIVEAIAKEQELDIVIGKAAVLLVQPELEITTEALERLNAQMPDANQLVEELDSGG